MLIATYARVSTKRQEDEETIETQIMAVNDWASKNGHTIVKEYRDEGWSGTILARPHLDELRLDARKKLWEAVLIYDPDRLARKYSYQELVTDELSELGIQVLYVTTPPAKDDSDKLLYGVKGLFAEYERARISERFRLGKLRKARDGNVVTSQAPYGYDYIPKQGDTQGYYKINKKEAVVVQMIFEWVANEGLTVRKVIKRLQELDIPPRKSKRGVWNTSTLTTLFRNETYIGIAHYNRSVAVVPDNPLKQEKYKRVKKTSRRWKPEADWVQIPVTAIIKKELFDKARKQLKTNFETCVRNKKNEYLLANVIYCTCGRKRAGEGPQRGKHLYYRCTDRVYSYPLPSSCHEKGVNARIADKLTWDGIVNLMSSPELLMEQAKRWMTQKQANTSDNTESIKELKEEVEKFKKEETKYIKAYGAEIISMGQFQEAMNDLKLRRSALERTVGQIESEVKKTDIIVSPNEEQIYKFSEAAKLQLKELGFEAKRRIILKVVNTVLGQQRQLRIRGYLPIQEIQNVKFKTNGRDRRPTKRWPHYNSYLLPRSTSSRRKSEYTGLHSLLL